MANELFAIIDDMSYTKQGIVTEDNESTYPAFMVNRALSQNPGLVLFACEMNKYPDLPKKMQYDFLFHSIPKKKRRDKWAKKAIASDDVELIMEAYNYNERHAVEACSLLNETELIQLRKQYDKGGRK